MIRASARRYLGATILLLAGAALAIAGLATVSRIRHVRQYLESAQLRYAQINSTLAGSLEGTGQLPVDPDELVALRTTISALRADLEAIEQLSRPALRLAKHLSWVPRIGKEIGAAPSLLEMADQACEMALCLLDGLVPLAERLHQSEHGVRLLGHEVTESLLAAQPEFSEARAAYERASRARQTIDASQLSPRLAEPLAQWQVHAPSMEAALDALDLLPEFLGAPQPRAFLVLAQNSDELRATGGFISGVGRVQIDQGQITSVSFQDSYSVDDLSKPHPVAPAPLRRYMGAGMLLLRDANWWADFPTSARMVRDLYAQDTGHLADGVIAVDSSALRLLIQATGPVGVPGYPEPVTADNLQDMLRKYWEAPLLVAPGDSTQWWSHRKDFAGDLLQALLYQVMDRATPEQLLALIRAMASSLRDRRIQVYLDDLAASALLHRAGWDGAHRATDGDYLMVVESNVGFNKVNPSIEQTIDYTVELSEDGYLASQLTLTYRHLVERPTPACIHEPRYGDSYADLTERCYWDYVRIYLPAGSEIVDVVGSDALPDIYMEAGHTVVGTGFLLETGQARALQFRYRQPIATDGNSYTLVVQKQAGAKAHLLRVRVRSPEVLQSLDEMLSPIVTIGSQAIWQTTLDHDVEIGVTWR